MKLLTFASEDATQHIGTLTDDNSTIAVLQAGARAMDGALSPFFTDMLAFLRGGTQAREKAQAVVEYVIAQNPPGVLVSVDDVTLLAPVPRPESIRDFMSFEQPHACHEHRWDLAEVAAPREGISAGRMIGGKGPFLQTV